MAKERLMNGSIKNDQKMNSLKKICDIDMDEYIAVGIHDARPTSSEKEEILHCLKKEKNSSSENISVLKQETRWV